jgi:septum formation protein
MRLILASTSPRRKVLLERLGIPFDIIAPRYQEVMTPNLTAEQQVVAFALGKARSIGIADAFVLGSDTLVVVDDLILGKPADIADARRMLTLLRGRTHRVITGVALIIPRGDGLVGAIHACPITSGESPLLWHEVTEVRMRDMSNEQIEWYLTTEEPFDKAGAYAIQGIGGQFIEQVNGNIDNVIGLPLQSVAAALQRYGFAISGTLK